MTKEEILFLLKQDEAEGKGEILQITEKGVEYFDYDFSWDDHTIFFRDEKFCTKEELKKMIFIAEESRKYGITEEYIASILVDAYSDCLVDMMTTLRAIAIIHSEEDMKEVFKFVDIAEDEDVCLENVVGLNIFDCQICIVNEGEVLNTLSEINIFKNYGSEIYADGIGVTVIHECRHQMLDCNFLLSEEKYPISLSEEDEVEEFSRKKWDNIWTGHILDNENVEELNKL